MSQTDENIKRHRALIALHAHGFTDREIAKELRLTPSDVKYARKRLGLARNEAVDHIVLGGVL